VACQTLFAAVLLSVFKTLLELALAQNVRNTDVVWSFGTAVYPAEIHGSSKYLLWVQPGPIARQCLFNNLSEPNRFAASHVLLSSLLDERDVATAQSWHGYSVPTGPLDAPETNKQLDAIIRYWEVRGHHIDR
jgi:hypothetical protein